VRVVRVERPADDVAIVYLQPSWLARLFGARLLCCRLKRVDRDNWRGASGLDLCHMDHGALIRAGLDCSPVDNDSLPVARVVEEAS
jgi:hypothetical protein